MVSSYRWLLFIVLFIGIFATNYLALTAREPLVASAAFTLMMLSVYGLEKFYSRGPEKVTDERTDLINMKAFYYGSLALIVTFMLEFIWLVSEDYETAILMAKYLLLPSGIMVLVAITSKAYLERVM